MRPERFDIDLGDDHYLRFCRWAPDRELNPQYDGIPDVEKYCAIIDHRKPDGTQCSGTITFRGDVQQRIDPNHASWEVQNWEPLTISPSVLCLAEGCGDHGFIRDGKWVRA